MVALVRDCSVKVTLRLFYPLFVVMTNGVYPSEGSEDHYRSKRLSQILLLCYRLLNSQNISMNKFEKGLVNRKPPM